MGDQTIAAIRRRRLKALINHRYGGTASALAAKMGLQPGNISRLFWTGDEARNIGERMARRIEELHELPPGWLDQDDEERRNRVPILDYVQAGNWRALVNREIAWEDWELVPMKLSDKAFALRVVGDSMKNPYGEPSFLHGCVVVADPEIEARPGKFVIAAQKGMSEATFKQLVKDGGKLYLKPLNPQYPTLEVADDAEIIGVVVRMSLSV